MSLKKEQIIEIQLAAKRNFAKRERERQEEKEYKEELIQAIAESKAPKVKAEKPEAESKKGK